MSAFFSFDCVLAWLPVGTVLGLPVEAIFGLPIGAGLTFPIGTGVLFFVCFAAVVFSFGLLAGAGGVAGLAWPAPALSLLFFVLNSLADSASAHPCSMEDPWEVP